MPEKTILTLIDTLEKSVADFDKSIPAIQKEIAKEIELFVKELDTTGDTIKSNVKNMRKIAAFKSKIMLIIERSDYPEQVKDFLKTFDKVASIQNTYFTGLSDKFKPTLLLDEIKIQSINSTIESLTESGLNYNLVEPISDILLKNITTGGSYSELNKQLRDYITTTPEADGALQKYTKQITTDSINQFSRQYTDTVANDLGLDWFMYDGSLLKTSRPFCEACVKKKYIHRSEFPALLKGNFPEFKEAGGVIYDKTGLPSGMIAGTNTSNFVVYAGGYNCGHSVIPVNDLVVPKAIRDKFA